MSKTGQTTQTEQTGPFEAAVAPVAAFNELVVKNLGTAFSMQVKSLNAYAKMGLSNLNAGLDVRNPDDFKAYMAAQKEVAANVAAQLTADAKAFGELSAKFMEQARALAEQNVTAMTAKAA